MVCLKLFMIKLFKVNYDDVLSLVMVLSMSICRFSFIVVTVLDSR